MTIWSGAVRLRRAIDAIVWELERLKSQPVEEEELARAKEMEKARILFGLERVQVVADPPEAGGQELLLGEIEPVEERVKLIEKTEAGELHLAPQEEDNIFPIIGFLHTLLFHAHEFVAHLLSVW